MKTAVMIATTVAAFGLAPALAQANSFDGFKIGAEASLQKNKVQITTPQNVELSGSDKGLNLRGFAGYDFSLSNSILLGGEIGVSRGGSTVEAATGTTTIEVDPGLTFDASARAGFIPAKNVLFYGRVGYMNSKVRLTTTNTGATPSTLSSKNRDGGLLWGVGTELKLSRGLGVRAEYRRSKLDELKTKQFVVGGYLKF